MVSYGFYQRESDVTGVGINYKMLIIVREEALEANGPIQLLEGNVHTRIDNWGITYFSYH